jgi:LysR family glycine cleavage system transcriptional activator
MTALPSTKALRAFETVVRLGSVSAAAQALAVSQSTLSRRIQALEEELGKPLFVRGAGGMALTEAGRVYAQRLRAIFQSLEDATHSVRASTPSPLKVMVPSIFNALLMRGWAHFAKTNPELQVDVLAYPGVRGSDARIGQADAVIYLGEEEWDGWECTYLTPNSHVMVVGAPHLLTSGMVEEARELENFTWIQSIYTPQGWQWWCNALGHPGLRPKKILEVANAVMGIEAAVEGLGLWLAAGSPRFGRDPATSSGALVLAHPFHAFTFRRGYYLACRPQSANAAALGVFRNWLLTETMLADPKADAGLRPPVIPSNRSA